MADLESRGVGSFQADLDAYHAINAVLRGRANHSQKQFAINGRSLEEMSISELKELAAHFAQQIRYSRNQRIITAVEG